MIDNQVERAAKNIARYCGTGSEKDDRYLELLGYFGKYRDIHLPIISELAINLPAIKISVIPEEVRTEQKQSSH